MRFLYTLLIGTAFTVGLIAQDEFGPQPKYDSSSVTALVDRVHSDLDHCYKRHKFSDSDRERLNKAEKQLREFAKKWEGGKFDKDELNDAIGSIQKVLDDNKLEREDREALSNDLRQLRRMREAWEKHQIGRE
jgi:hypothetical protein